MGQQARREVSKEPTTKFKRYPYDVSFEKLFSKACASEFPDLKLFVETHLKR